MNDPTTHLGGVVPIQGENPGQGPGTTVTSPAGFDPILAIYPLGVAPNAPVSDERNNHPIVAFAQDQDQFVDFTGHMLSEYAGENLRVGIIWASDVVAGDVEWFVSWEREEIGGPFDLDANDFAAEKSAVSGAPATSGFLQRVDIIFTNGEADGIQAGECFRLRIRRDGGQGNDDMLGIGQLVRIVVEAT